MGFRVFGDGSAFNAGTLKQLKDGAEEVQNPTTQPGRQAEMPDRSLEPVDYDDEGVRNFDTIEDIDRAATTGLGVKDYMRPDLGAAPRGPVGLPVSGLDPSRVGGWQRLDSAYDDTNARGQEALQEAADISTAENKDLEQHYTALRDEASAIRATRLQHQQENIAVQQQKQQELDEKTKMYSQNLADRGAFWKDPGNVVSAIAFALLPLAGVTGGVGMRLVNNAIQQDLANRRELADSHLGALKSNITGYRQLAASIEAGDALAEAEAYRIAGLEVQRIASHYQGQKSQTTAKAMMAELNGKMNESYMKAIFHMVNIEPHIERDPRLKAARENRPGYVNYLNGSQPQSSSSAVPGGQGSVPANASVGSNPTDVQQRAIEKLGGKTDKWKAGQVLGPGASVADAGEQPEGGPGNEIPVEVKSTIERKAPYLAKALADRSPIGMKTWDIIKNEIQTKAERIALKSADPRANPQRYKQVVAAVWEEEWDKIEGQKEKIASASKEFTQDFEVYGAIQKDTNDIKALFNGDMNKCNEFMHGIARGVAPGSTQAWNELMNRLGVAGSDREARVKAAAERFNQLVGGVVANHYHKMAGAAMSDNELAILKRDLPQNPSFQAFENFLKMRSRALGAQYKNVLDHAPSEAAKMLYLLGKGTRSTGVTSTGKEPNRGPKPGVEKQYGSVDQNGKVQIKNVPIEPPRRPR